MNEIKIEDFEQWVEKEHEISFSSSYGSGSDKNLFITTYGKIKVRDHNFIVYEGVNINDAVKCYNNCI